MLKRELYFPSVDPMHTLYAYEPAYAGQESVEKDGDTPVFKFGVVKPVYMSMPPKWEYMVYTKSNDKPVPAGVVSSVCSIYPRATMSDVNGEPMLRFQKEKNEDDFVLEVSEGMDPIQAVLIAV